MSNPILTQFRGLALGQVVTTPFVSKFVGNISGGQFLFSGLVPFHSANPGALYYIDDIEVSSNIDTLVFSDAMVDPLILDVLDGTRFKLNKSGIPVIGSGNIPLQMFYKVSAASKNKTKTINVQLNGALNITAALAARSTVSVYVRGVLYQITDTNWIRAQIGG